MLAPVPCALTLVAPPATGTAQQTGTTLSSCSSACCAPERVVQPWKLARIRLHEARTPACSVSLCGHWSKWRQVRCSYSGSSTGTHLPAVLWLKCHGTGSRHVPEQLLRCEQRARGHPETRTIITAFNQLDIDASGGELLHRTNGGHFITLNVVILNVLLVPHVP